MKARLEVEVAVGLDSVRDWRMFLPYGRSHVFLCPFEEIIRPDVWPHVADSIENEMLASFYWFVMLKMTY